MENTINSDETAYLLCNLGSPDDCTEAAVRPYLNQFLMDPSVIQLPWLIRRLIVSLFVLPKRPKKSAEAYAKIWTKDGSPLISLSRKLLAAVTQKNNSSIYLAMRYGNPSVEDQILKISKNPHIKRIYFLPMYPHFADSTVSTSIIEAQRVIGKHELNIELIVHPCFYNDANYIKALVESSAPYLFENQSPTSEQASQNITTRQLKSDLPHILFSYHGLPELHLTKADPTNSHCLKNKSCCEMPSIAHKTCYRHQVFETTRLFVESVGLTEAQYSISFQSRLGRAKWLEPSTENTLVELAKNGIKDVLVICPAFVTDCLETLEEIAIEGESTFKSAGGNSLQLIPCLNDHPNWVDLVASWCRLPKSKET